MNAECVAAAYWSQEQCTDRDPTHTHTHKQRPLRRGISVDNRGQAKRGVALPVQIASVQPERRSGESETDTLGADARKSVPHWDTNPTDPGLLCAEECLQETQGSSRPIVCYPKCSLLNPRNSFKMSQTW